MPRVSNGSNKFRAVMQQLWMHRLRSSPRRVIAAVASHPSHAGRSGAGAHPYYTQLQQYAAALQRRCGALWHDAVAGTAPDAAAPNSARAMNTIEQLRCKVQEAMQVAAAEAAQRRPAGVVVADTAGGEEGGGSTARQLYHRVQDAVRETRRYYNSIPFDERWDGIQRGLDALGRTSTGSCVTVYHDSGEAFAAMWAAVDGAAREVLWQTYICKDDHVGRHTVRKLLAAQRRGCRTELLYDCGGNIAGRGRLTEELRQSGASVICYRPFFRSFFHYLYGGLDWRISPGLRNHRKILLVDGEVGFCGGLNIGNEYCGPDQGGTGAFRDTHCRLTGPAVVHLRAVYDDTTRPRPWKFAWRRWRQIASSALSRRYEQGKHAMQLSGALRKKGDDDAQTTAVTEPKRRRWERQRRRFQRRMEQYRARHAARVGGEDGASRVGVMRSKIDAARARALERVSDLAYKRSFTKLLRHVPLADDEAVPEAEVYGLRRRPVTQVLSCNPRYRDYSIQFAYWQVTRKCHRRVWVTTPYYLPTPRLLRALVQAANRGVDVRLLAGSRQTTDPWFMWHASKYITERLLRAGVRVYEYKGPAIMHAKTVVADSIWCSIGSYNWDVLSNKNLEVCVCQTDFQLAREMERQFLRDLDLSEEVLLRDHSRRSLWLRFTAWLFYHAVYLANRLTFFTYVNEDVDEGGR